MTTDSTTDSTTGEVATWQVITGSARGAAHRASGLPNQDAVASQDGAGVVVVAIADGHGHIRHFRSADGAALAVDVACRAASRAATGLAADTIGDKEAERAGQALARAVVSDWRSAVAGQIGVRPYTVGEQFILDRSADTPVVPYGSTSPETRCGWSGPGRFWPWRSASARAARASSTRPGSTARRSR